ncbi:Arrestin (or s-antigen) n-terminal domain protein [Neofusicoccum parvum]|uniref:Putative arrestin (Or s-antigen) n-terminal domain protein n=1 Tax=Botryosphaeria parva (strain UCR-NP2) TaxID=1287680 RepID=R1GAG3_BOTPV|nr:putative arrestin (or s-antigen) n-terminal domain protein [Neofusicoccum parvum UCRNP2]GME44021.1 Arrestin (or s-antigen) n-terminal domain protein [Neofusicoccum parvum]
MPGLLHFPIPRRTDSSSPPPYEVDAHETKILAKVIKRATSPSRTNMDPFKRHSIGIVGRHKSERKSATKLESAKPAKMNLLVESPPIVLYNSPQNSTGAIFSGQLLVDVTDPEVSFDKFEMQLLATTTTKEPVAKQCSDCTSQTTELKKWTFNQGQLTLNKGEHQFPFSYLVPGHLPASTNNPLVILDYHLAAEATTATGEVISFGRSIIVKRAILPGNDKHSVRIFPPTNLTASVTLPNVVHPIGDFNVEMRMSGLVEEKRDKSTTRWKLRKLNWRIEEHTKFVSPACPKHIAKVGGEGKGIIHEDTRVIGSDDVKHGWKTDIQNDSIEVEFNAMVNPLLKPTCDVQAENGLEVKHNLVVEMVVAEEWAPDNKPTQVTPTGAARVLRTQFNLVLTERAGLGISWDEEQPPMYEDIPDSPPTYSEELAPRMSDEIERLSLNHS